MNKKITERWQVTEDPFSETLEIRDEGGRRIAVCVRDFPMSEKTREANAHKIAAAPEMLGALVSIREVLVAGNQGVFEDRIISESLEICENAIKKARGETA